MTECVINLKQRLSVTNSSTDRVYDSEDIIGIYATTVVAGVTIIFCAFTGGLAFFNTFGVYASWLYGPPMLYVLSLFSGNHTK